MAVGWCLGGAAVGRLSFDAAKLVEFAIDTSPRRAHATVQKQSLAHVHAAIPLAAVLRALRRRRSGT